MRSNDALLYPRTKPKPGNPGEEGLSIPQDQWGTTIEVSTLHPDVSAQFALENFKTRLANEIQDAHRAVMADGLAITLNGMPLSTPTLSLLQSKDIKSAHRKMRFKEPGRAQVKVDIYCGLSESDPQTAGWYLFCNGRLVLGADQTLTTGWGETAGQTAPKYHNQFARFRGYTALVAMGMQDFAFEAVVCRHPSVFSPSALKRSQERLKEWDAGNAEAGSA